MLKKNFPVNNIVDISKNIMCKNYLKKNIQQNKTLIFNKIKNHPIMNKKKFKQYILGMEIQLIE